MNRSTAEGEPSCGSGWETTFIQCKTVLDRICRGLRISGCAALAASLLLTNMGDASAQDTQEPGRSATAVSDQRKDTNTMKLEINGQSFAMSLANTKAAAALQALAPLEFSMSELNGNEFYVYLSARLPAEADYTGKIRAGDVMLWQNNCLVIFYESFDTSYSYTRIGTVAEAGELRQLTRGKKSVGVRLSAGD